MSQQHSSEIARPRVSRRDLITGLGRGTLSATALLMVGGCTATNSDRPHSSLAAAADVKILNVALGLEHEAIGAYQLAADSGLLSKPVLDVARQFQAHHKGHRDTIARVVGKLGGEPVDGKTLSIYSANLGLAQLKSEIDVLILASQLEKEAVNAYLEVIPEFQDSRLQQFAGRLAADEAMHWTVLSQALKQPLPAKALSFGFG